MNPWPHQLRAVRDVQSAIKAGERRVLLTSPTGGGKTRIACMLIDAWLQEGHRIVVYTNRKMLVDQLSEVLARHGISHGVRAAGYEDQRWQDVQISSIQTENARVLRKGSWGLHDAERVIIDEAHLQVGEVMKHILGAHHEEGAHHVGLTATPIGLSAYYDHLIVAGKNSELRECGALVPCLHYGPDEPDLRHIGRVALGEDLSEQQNVKAIMTPTIWARVFEWWRTLNPDGKPTILFAPGVGESVWFAEQFVAQGVSAAHIDGSDVWVNGRTFRSSREARADILEASKDGRIRVLCNRFVLREGIDAPWLAHGIFATVFGSLQSYLQSGGRLLRAFLGLEHVVLQDHGGNWWRHGSLNSDRSWHLDDTPARIAARREDRLRNKTPEGEREPVCCPACQRILTGYRCLGCGFEINPKKKSRPVIQQDGSLRQMTGDIYKPRRICTKPNGPALWEKMFHRARSAKWDATFRQAEAMYAMENNWAWPDRSWPLMPKDPEHLDRKVAKMLPEQLIPKPKDDGP